METKTYWEADVELAIRLNPVVYPGYGLPDLDTSLSLGILLGRKWSAGLSIPFSITGLAASTAPVLFIPGDLSASIGWTAMYGDGRVRGGLNLTGPSAQWQANQEVPGHGAGGAGRWTLGLSGGVSRIIDPLVFGSLVSWSIGLPRAERWDRLWRPGDFSLVLSVTEVFNEKISTTVVLSQDVSMPETVWGASLGDILSGAVVYDASAGVKLHVSGKSFTGGLGFSKSLVRGADPGSLNFSITYIIRQRERP